MPRFSRMPPNAAALEAEQNRFENISRIATLIDAAKNRRLNRDFSERELAQRRDDNRLRREDDRKNDEFKRSIEEQDAKRRDEIHKRGLISFEEQRKMASDFKSAALKLSKNPDGSDLTDDERIALIMSGATGGSISAGLSNGGGTRRINGKSSRNIGGDQEDSEPFSSAPQEIRPLMQQYYKMQLAGYDVDNLFVHDDKGNPVGINTSGTYDNDEKGKNGKSTKKFWMSVNSGLSRNLAPDQAIDYTAAGEKLTNVNRLYVPKQIQQDGSTDQNGTIIVPPPKAAPARLSSPDKQMLGDMILPDTAYGHGLHASSAPAITQQNRFSSPERQEQKAQIEQSAHDTQLMKRIDARRSQLLKMGYSESQVRSALENDFRPLLGSFPNTDPDKVTNRAGQKHPFQYVPPDYKGEEAIRSNAPTRQDIENQRRINYLLSSPEARARMNALRNNAVNEAARDAGEYNPYGEEVEQENTEFQQNNDTEYTDQYDDTGAIADAGLTASRSVGGEDRVIVREPLRQNRLQPGYVGEERRPEQSRFHAVRIPGRQNIDTAIPPDTQTGNRYLLDDETMRDVRNPGRFRMPTFYDGGNHITNTGRFSAPATHEELAQLDRGIVPNRFLTQIPYKPQVGPRRTNRFASIEANKPISAVDDVGARQYVAIPQTRGLQVTTPPRVSRFVRDQYPSLARNDDPQYGMTEYSPFRNDTERELFRLGLKKAY